MFLTWRRCVGGIIEAGVGGILAARVGIPLLQQSVAYEWCRVGVIIPAAVGGISMVDGSNRRRRRCIKNITAAKSAPPLQIVTVATNWHLRCLKTQNPFRSAGIPVTTAFTAHHSNLRKNGKFTGSLLDRDLFVCRKILASTTTPAFPDLQCRKS